MQSLTSKDCAEETAELFSMEQQKYTADRWAKERVILEYFLKAENIAKVFLIQSQKSQSLLHSHPQKQPAMEDRHSPPVKSNSYQESLVVPPHFVKYSVPITP